jgi:hypothetical protein
MKLFFTRRRNGGGGGGHASHTSNLLPRTGDLVANLQGSEGFSGAKLLILPF